MELITNEIKERLQCYPLYSQDGKGKRAKCVAKFFLAQGAWTWYVLEADLEEGTFFGITINGHGEGEYGYTSINELQNVKSRIGTEVERDLWFEPTILKDIDDEYLQEFLTNMYGE